MYGDHRDLHVLTTSCPTRRASGLDDANYRARIAAGLGDPDWHALGIELDAVRGQVATEFDALLAPRERKPDAGALTAYWQALPEGGDRSEEHTSELQ